MDEDVMPGLARKLLIYAAVDGLVLQPVARFRESSNADGVRIEYGTNRIVSTATQDGGAELRLEAHGIIGSLDLVSTSYLISITRREEVAQIRGKAVYRVTDVTLIPLNGKKEAESAIAAARALLKQEQHLAYEEHDAIERASIDEEQPEDYASALEPPPEGGVVKKSTTFVRDVVKDKGVYGRFADKWFSRNGSTEQARRQVGLPAKEEEDGGASKLTKEQMREAREALPEDEGEVLQKAVRERGEKEADSATDNQMGAGDTAQRKHKAIEYLAPRILRSARVYFSSSGFYFSYDHDLSARLSYQRPASSTPMWKWFDSLYFWNRNLTRPFINAGQDALVLPLLHGFVGQRSFSIAETDGDKNDVVADATPESREDFHTTAQKPEGIAPDVMQRTQSHDLLLTLISRRSTKRAGLRYLRRGIDDEGSVANSVETEQILSTQDWSDAQKTFSLVQYRGSMPLFFSQSPYSFKPIPQFFGSEATNQAAFKKHFRRVAERYGAVQCVSLVDKHPPESAAGELYEKHAKLLNENGAVGGKNIYFNWFDFHGICKGMRFENVQVLMAELHEQLKAFGWNERQNDSVSKQQTGVVRTNCMDCLDRTNVVQSAIASWALEQQLGELGLSIDLMKDPKTQWFNTLWADNGDACSRQYAGTSALKGDFTRTRKRNWTGALSDFSLTLNRYYNNIFGDYFLQTNIDYFLGNAGPGSFDEFESDMKVNQYPLDMRNIRQNAIDTCIKIVLEDPNEELISGWTLGCPAQSNTLKTLPFEECVLLLTDTALYFCRFDWDTEKVGSFERVDLRDIKAIWRGAYITSTLGSTHLDENKNVGFAMRYETKGSGTVRTNTRSLSVAEGAKHANDHQDNDRGKKAAHTAKGIDTSRLLAFKALPAKVAAAKDEEQDQETMSEREMLQHICDEIHRAAAKVWTDFQHIEVDKAPEVEEKDVISVAEAKRSTTYVEQLGYNLKKMVWS